jgi:4a-hydroxytetrahydrobiopterin dehydratase
MDVVGGDLRDGGKNSAVIRLIRGWRLPGGAAVKVGQYKGATVASLSKDDIRERVKKMEGWTYQENALHKKYTFESFLPGIQFVNKIAEAAEKAGHHPDITINYNVVGISLSTHSAGGVTEKDFDLAGRIDQIRGKPS